MNKKIYLYLFVSLLLISFASAESFLTIYNNYDDYITTDYTAGTIGTTNVLNSTNAYTPGVNLNGLIPYLNKKLNFTRQNFSFQPNELLNYTGYHYTGTGASSDNGYNGVVFWNTASNYKIVWNKKAGTNFESCIFSAGSWDECRTAPLGTLSSTTYYKTNMLIYNLSNGSVQVNITWFLAGGTASLNYSTRHAIFNTFQTIMTGFGDGSGSGGSQAYFDEEQLTIYNSTTIPAFSPLAFSSQTPSNITSTTLFKTNVLINYTFNTTLNLSVAYGLNYTSYGSLNCSLLINGSCIIANNTYRTITPSSNTSTGGLYTFSFSIGENNLYPQIANLNDSFFSQTHNVQTLTTNNHYIKTTINNLTNKLSYNILEANINTSGTIKVFACNSSYSTGNILTSPNCLEIGNINTTTFNHSHSLNVNHNLVPFSVLNGKINGLLGFSETMTFVFRSLTGTANAFYVPNISRVDNTMSSINSGVTWNTISGTLDAHIHSYGNNEEYIKYQAFGSYAGALYNTTFTTELIEVEALNPNPPVIYFPFNSTITSSIMNINWSNATATNPSQNISNHVLQLLNNDLTLNRTIASNLTLSTYALNIYNENLTTGTYYIKVIGYDQNGLNSFDFESFDLVTNANLNLTAIFPINSTLISNFTINATNLNTGNITTASTTNGSLQLGIIKQNNYTFFVDSPSFAFHYQNYTTTNATFQNLQFSLYTNNSISITAKDETTGSIILESLQVVVTGTTETTYNLTNGTLFISNLLDGAYTLKFSGENYTLRTYTISVASRSTQSLEAILSKATTAVVFTIKDALSDVLLEGATISMYKLINASYTLIETKNSDITGRAQFTYSPLVKYRFYVSNTGYSTKTFDLDPIIFTSYDVKLDRNVVFPNTQDYAGVTLIYYPKTFYNNKSNNLTFIINAPNGELVSYGINITYPGGIVSLTGNNAIGGNLYPNFTITNAGIFSTINITYWYDTTLAEPKYFSDAYFISGALNENTTFINLKNQDYGLGSLDKMLIVIFFVIIGAGMAYLAGAGNFALVFGLFIYVYFVAIGFLPLWSVLIALMIGFIFILGREATY